MFNIVPIDSTICGISYDNSYREGRCMHFATRYAESPMINHIVRHLACNATLVNKISVSLSLFLSLSLSLTHSPGCHTSRGRALCRLLVCIHLGQSPETSQKTIIEVPERCRSMHPAANCNDLTASPSSRLPCYPICAPSASPAPVSTPEN